MKPSRLLLIALFAAPCAQAQDKIDERGALEKEIYELMVREGLLKAEVDYRRAYTTQFVKDLRVMP